MEGDAMGAMMDREALGRLLVKVDAEVFFRTITWESLTRDDHEKVAEVAARFLAAATASPSRSFHARVVLVLHRDLGLCRVTEAPLAGVTMLRCERDGAVEWVHPAAVHSVKEVPDTEALVEIAKAAAEEARFRQVAAESRARRNAERAKATADVVVDREHDLTALRASRPDLLRRHDPDLAAALNAEGIEFCSEFSNSDDRFIGIVIQGDHSDALARVSDALGFVSGSIRPPLTDDELDLAIPF